MSRLNPPVLLPSVAALLLGGCAAVGPDYAPPSPALPAAFDAMPAGVAAGEVEALWWRGFDDPALDLLIERALAANHDVGIAAARLEEAKALLRENSRNFLPRGGVAAGHEQRRRSEIELPPGMPREMDSWRLAADASWEIDLFGRIRRSVEAARAEAGSREALLRGVQAGVAAEVASTWFELRGTEAELAVLADISQNQRESLRTVERLAAAGSASEFDRLRAEALLHGVEAAVPELERRRAASVNALAVLLGEIPQGFVPPPSAANGELAVRTIAVDDPAALLARRSDIAAAERRLAAATARIGVETANLYPSVEVQGSIGLLSGDLDAIGEGGALSWLLGPVIRWALLDTGRVRARIAAGEARAKEALIAYDQTVLKALEETRNAFTAYGAAGDALRLRLLEAAASRKAASLARTRFAAGQGLYLDVLEAERSDLASRRALTLARTGQQLAVVGIYRALGGGWEMCGGTQRDCSGADGTKRAP